MPTRTSDKRAIHAGSPADVAEVAARQLPLPALAMATASRLYAAAAGSAALPSLTAKALATQPGQMCMVSFVARGDEGLRPVAASHAQAGTARYLRSVIVPRRNTPADAFSHTVLRSGGALRMAITRPRQLRLWLPAVYWPYVERAGVTGVLAAALMERGQPFGALLLWRERDQPPFDESDQAYVVTLAARLALGLAEHPLVGSAPTASYN
jgi:GAF domain-containing protein